MSVDLTRGMMAVDVSPSRSTNSNLEDVKLGGIRLTDFQFTCTESPPPALRDMNLRLF